MNVKRSLAYRNVLCHKGRSVSLFLLAALLAVAVFAGTMLIASLERGFSSLEARLGADIVVIPASTEASALEGLLLQGVPGYFYMPADVEERIRSVEGVEKTSPQMYLASADSACCSMPVQIIGIDPETDFTIQPWIKNSYDGSLSAGDVAVGSSIFLPREKTVHFFNQNCRVAAQLDRTGTGLDRAVFANIDTIKTLLAASESLGLNSFHGNPADVVSAIMVKVTPGCHVGETAGQITSKVAGVKAVETKSMISGIAKGLAGASQIIRYMLAFIWLLCLVIMAIAFSMITRERRKEFAVLRVIGASRQKLMRLVLGESLLLTFSGAVAGVFAAALVVFPFTSYIEIAMGLPFLLPTVSTCLFLAIGTLCATVATGSLISAWSACRLSRVDAGNVLR